MQRREKAIIIKSNNNFHLERADGESESKMKKGFLAVIIRLYIAQEDHESTGVHQKGEVAPMDTE